MQDVILERAPSGAPQFASVGGRLWNSAANPAALTGNDAIAYRAARGIANDLLYGSEFNSYDPTVGATYFYSSPTNTPPPGFFTSRVNSGRLQKTYEAGRPQYGDIFTFLRDTQP